jgi:hypothetical protein
MRSGWDNLEREVRWKRFVVKDMCEEILNVVFGETGSYGRTQLGALFGKLGRLPD